MKKIAITTTVIVALLVIVPLTGCVTEKKQTGPTLAAGEEIRIGLLFPLTGPLGEGQGLGVDSKLGAQLAIDYVNEHGGVLGKFKVKYFTGDDTGCILDPNAATTEAERLITQEKIQVLVSSWSSAAAMAASTVCEEKGVVCWLPVAWDPLITMQGYKYTFRAGINAFHAGYAGADLVYTKADKLGKQPSEITVAIINAKNSFGTGVADAAQSKAQSYGMNVVYREEYSSTQSNFTTMINNLTALAPDVLMHAAYPPDTTTNLFCTQAITLGLKVKAYIAFGAGHGSGSSYAAMGPDLMEGIPIFDYPSINENSPYLSDIDPELKSAMLDFFDRFEQQRGHPPLSQTVNSFGVTLILLNQVYSEAIKKYSSVDPENLVKILRDLNLPQDEVPMGFPVKFYSPGNLEAGQNMYSTPALCHWINGKLVDILPERYSQGTLVYPLPSDHPFYKAP